jgi:hypothetical protein
MPISELAPAARRMTAPLPIWRANVAADTWLVVAASVAKQGGRLVSLWGSDVASDTLHGVSVQSEENLSEILIILGEYVHRVGTYR